MHLPFFKYLSVHSCKCRVKKAPDLLHTGPLTSRNYRDALSVAIKVTQYHYLPDVIEALIRHKPCPKKYQQLAPFLTTSDLVMVEGHLRHSQLTSSIKHPLLIPTESRLAT